MSTHHSLPDRSLDPVCGMSVRIALAEEEGLVVESGARRVHFCRAGCRDAFLAEPARYALPGGVPKTQQPTGGAVDLLTIDQGMRRWYESCSCCLSDAYPEVKAALDAERQATDRPTADPGICEVAEAGEPAGATPR